MRPSLDAGCVIRPNRLGRVVESQTDEAHEVSIALRADNRLAAVRSVPSCFQVSMEQLEIYQSLQTLRSKAGLERLNKSLQ